jgi:hypothetical protein
MPINPAFVYQNFFGPPSNCHPLNHASPDVHCYGVDGRQLDLDGLTAAPIVRALKVRRASSLSELEKLPKLEALDLDEPESLVGLSALTRLKFLAMSHFTPIHSLQPLGALTALTGLSLSTIASWGCLGACSVGGIVCSVVKTHSPGGIESDGSLARGRFLGAALLAQATSPFEYFACASISDDGLRQARPCSA